MCARRQERWKLSCVRGNSGWVRIILFCIKYDNNIALKFKWISLRELDNNVSTPSRVRNTPDLCHSRAHRGRLGREDVPAEPIHEGHHSEISGADNRRGVCHEGGSAEGQHVREGTDLGHRRPGEVPCHDRCVLLHRGTLLDTTGSRWERWWFTT